MALYSTHHSNYDIGESDSSNFQYKLKSPNRMILCADLSHQSLPEFSFDKVVEPSYLQFLYMRGNAIKKLPSDFFCSFPALRHLDLRQNQLLEIPESISGHSGLEVLLLQDNQLTCLPYALGQVPRLRKLQFSGNPLQWPPDQVLSGGLTTILSYLRGAFMEKLRRGRDDESYEPNQYGMRGGDSRTKCSGEDSEVHSADPTAQNSALEGKVIVKPQATYFEKLESSSTSGLLESYDKNEHTDYLKGSSQQLKLKQRVNTNINNVVSKSQKGSLFKPHISPRHAQAVINGQTFPLGYKKRTSPGVSTSKICKTLLQQLWLNQLKCVLQSQDYALQKQKSSEALRQWRQKAKALQSCNGHQNWSGLDVPYDIDAQYLKMVTRSGLQMNESLEKKGHSKPHMTCVKAMGLQEKISHIIQSFDEMRSNKASSHSNTSDQDPTMRRKLLAEELKRISNLQKAVQALRLSA